MSKLMTGVATLAVAVMVMGAVLVQASDARAATAATAGVEVSKAPEAHIECAADSNAEAGYCYYRYEYRLVGFDMWGRPVYAWAYFWVCNEPGHCHR